MSQKVLSQWWEHFKNSPWEDDWLFLPGSQAPDPPDVILDLTTLEEFRNTVVKEPGPYGSTSAKAIDGFLATFLLPFLAHRQASFVQVLSSAIGHQTLRPIALEALSMYFATGTPKRLHRKTATDDQRNQIHEPLARVASSLSLEETRSACTLATALDLRDVIGTILDHLGRFSLHDQLLIRLELEGDGWLTPDGALFDHRQEVTEEKYLEICDRLNALR